MSRVRAHVMIRGRVQGVFYRVRAREQAVRLQLTGWVKNKPDGTVEGVFEGEQESVAKMLAWCRQGPPGAAVSGLEIEWEEPRGDFSGFTIAASGA